MEKRSIVGITLIIGIVLVIALIGWSYIIPIEFKETNKTIQPVPQPDDHSNQGLGALSQDMVLEKSLPGNVDRVLVYKTVPAHYTRQDILSLAQKFNISPIGKTKEVSEGSSVASTDGKIQAILHNSGYIEYHNSDRVGPNPVDVPGILPSDDEALKIATKFLNDRDLLPDDAEFRKIDHSRAYFLGNDGNDSLAWEDVEVWYGRKLNGYTVEGTQLELALGSNGDPIEYITNWRNYEPYKEMQIKKPDIAFEELKTKGVVVGSLNKPYTVSINQIYLAYHTKAGAETEEYLEPIWVFEGNVLSEGKSVRPVEEYVSALPTNPETTLIQTVTPTLTIPDALVSVNVTVIKPSSKNTTAETPTASQIVNLTPS